MLDQHMILPPGLFPSILRDPIAFTASGPSFSCHFTLKNYSDSHSIQFDFKMAAGIDDSNLDKFSSVVTPKV